MISLVSLICMAFVWLAEIRVQAQEAQEAPDEPGSLYARSAVLLDADSGRVLFGKEADVKRPMASTTKIMTCILTLENMSEEQTATVSERAAGDRRERGRLCGYDECKGGRAGVYRHAFCDS